MANADQPTGFMPIRHLAGGVGAPRSSEYSFASGFATALFRGDVVALSSGLIVRAADNTGTILGVVRGFEWIDIDGTPKFTPNWVANAATLNSAAVKVHVWDDPMIEFRVQCDTGTAYVEATHRGIGVDIELDHAGSVFTGQSGMEVDLSDTGDEHFLVLGLVDEPGNAAGANAKLRVKMLNSVLGRSA